MKSAARPSPAVQWLSQRQGFIAWGILALGLALSIALTIGVRKQVEQEARHRFEANARDVLYRVQTEVGSYEEVLVGLSAFLGSKEGVSRSEFRHYVAGLDLPKRFPGFDNLNYAQIVPDDELKRFEQSVRRDESVHKGGYPDFAVAPAGLRSDYHVIVFVEPWEKSPVAFGKDLNMIPGVPASLARIRDTGEISTAGRLIRIVESDRRVRVGLAMRFAVYRSGAALDSIEARRAAFKGSVGAGYRIADVMRAAVSKDQLGNMRFVLVDRGPVEGPASEENMLFDSNELLGLGTTEGTRPEAKKKNDQFEEALGFPIGGRAWQLNFSAPMQSAGAIGRALPWLVLAGGLITTALLFGLFNSFANSRRRAEALAETITHDLRESKTSLAEAERMARLGNWSLDLRDGRMRWSDEAIRLLGLRAEEAPVDMQAFFDHVHPEDRERVRQAIGDCHRHSKGFDIEHRIVVDGAERWVHGLGESRLGDDGRVEFVRGTMMDISERKLGTRRKELESTLARLFAIARPTAETMTDVLNAICAECAFVSGRYWEVEPDVDTTGAILLPLVADQTLLGTIALFGREGDSLHPDLLKLLEGVVAQVAQYLLRRRAEDKFKHLATHDALSGLPNRLLFGERVSEAIARSERAKRGLAVLLIDLDRFKNVNDTLGHGAGDAVLKSCAERLGRCLRDTDLVARSSGDEFAVLVEPCAQPAAAIAVARKILAAVERPLIIQGHEIVLTGSVGISIYHEDGRDVETLLKHADIAMFRAKENGRNNYQFYAAQMNPHSLQRLSLESALRRALERNEFALHYQPKFDLKSGSITGVEALLRWKHAELGNVSPAQFIPIAEETGLIEPIGAWVLKEACAQAASWHQQGLRGVRVAVNLSARQFRNQKLGRDIRKCLVESGLDPKLLELELTESLVMQDPEQAAAMLNELKSLGLSLSIDDFGTGYSSLAYLKRFPIDSVKVDRSFVKDIPDDAEDLAIVEAVIALAHSLGLSVVAEGVETEEQHAHLKRLGCNEMQGYFKSKPLPADEATRFLEAGLNKEGRSRASRAPFSIVT